MKKSFSSFRQSLPISVENIDSTNDENEEINENIQLDDDPDVEETNQIIMPSDLDCPVFVMCPPFSLDASNPNNIWMKKLSSKERKVNKLKAFQQFFSVYLFVSNAALVYLLPSKKGLQDLPYVANLGINLPHLQNNEIVLANFRSEPREGETIVGKEFFENLGYSTVISPPFFEGEADLKYLNKNVYCGAYGMDNINESLNWFKKTYDMNVIPIKVTSEKLYHLDCLVFPLDKDYTMVVTSLLDKATIKQIEKHTTIIDVNEKAYGLTNSVRLSNWVLNGTSIDEMKKGTDEYDDELMKNNLLEKLTTKYGYQPVFFNISEFAKSGADLSCMFFHLNYPNFKMSDE